jgi:hypothetical protein
MLTLNLQAKNESEMTYQCEFCHKTFARESTIVAHMCEPKRRRMQQNERSVQIGFQAYLEFYRLLNKSAKVRTYDDFAESPYYRAFVKFGRYCVDTLVINPARMIDWLLKNQKKIDQWCSDRIYTEYLIWYLQTESVADALARSVEYSIDWAERNEARPQDCLRYGSANGTCHAITTGRISPWVIYNSDSGQEFLTQLSSEQLQIVWPYINSDVWQAKFGSNTEDLTYAREILNTAGW